MAAQREWYEKDYYKVLGVAPEATPLEITKAYRKLARDSHPDTHPGDIDDALAKGSAKVDQTYVTPIQNHNPIEPHATIAWWEGEKLNVYDATQYISGVKQSLARVLNIPVDDVRVQCPYTGGGFGVGSVP